MINSNYIVRWFSKYSRYPLEKLINEEDIGQEIIINLFTQKSAENTPNI